MAFRQIALAPAVVGGIDREAERAVARCDGTFRHVVDPGGIAARVELIDAQGLGRRLRYGLQARLAHRTQHVADAELLRRLDRRAAAFGREQLQSADRRKDHRQAQLASEKAG